MAFGRDDTLDRLRRASMLAAASRNQVDPSLPARLDGYQKRYWWMDPSAKWSMSKAGIDPTDPTAQLAATSAASVEADSGFGFRDFGSPVLKPSVAPDVTSILHGLDSKLTASVATPDPAQYAAQPSMLAQINPDGWAKLQPNEQAELSKVTLSSADKGQYLTGYDAQTGVTAKAGSVRDSWNDPSVQVYKVDGFEKLSPFWQQKIGELLTKAVDPEAGSFGQQRQGFTNYQGRGVSFENGTLITGGKSISDWFQANKGAGTFDVLAPLAPVLRPANVVAAAPFQELVGEFRNLYALAHGKTPNFLESQSDLGVAIGQSGFNPSDWDIGNGLFVDPAGSVEQERQRRIEQRGLINGHGITVGRALASFLPDSIAGVHVFEPGSKPYALLSGLVDAAVAIKADPTAKALKESNAIRELDKNLAYSQSSVLEAGRAVKAGENPLSAFEQAGGIRGIRPTLDPEAGRVWLDSPHQLPVLEKFAAEKDPYNIWRALNRKGDPALAARIADADTAPDVANVLRDELGVTIREKFGANDLPTSGYESPSRWVANMPSASVRSDSLAANALEVERAASLLKAPEAKLHEWFDQMARTTDEFERLGVWEKIADDTAERLVGKGVALDRARKLTRLASEEELVDKVYSQDRISKGLGMFDEQAVVDGKVIVTRSSPHILAQHLDGQIPLMEWRELRRALSPLRPILENKALQGTEHLVLTAQNKVWKAVQIATVKTMIKVVADDQAKMVALGYDALPNHPIRALSMILASPLSELPSDAGFIARMQHAAAGKLRGVVGAIPGVEPRVLTTGLGEDFGDVWEIQQAAAHGANHMAEDPLGMIAANNWQEVHKTADNLPQFTNAWARDVAQYASSPDVRGLVRAGSLQEAQDWWWDGPGKMLREKLAKAGPNGHPELLEREGADRWADLTLQQVNAKTNGNPNLLNAIATGKLDGAPIWMATEDGSMRVAQAYVDKMGTYLDDAPLVSRSPKMLFSFDKAQRQILDRMTHRALQTLLGTPSAVLSKSPLFRQKYWEELTDTAPFMTGEAQSEVLRVAANEANLPRNMLNDLAEAIEKGNAKRTPFSGTVSLEQADTMAKGRALDLVEFLTDEATSRSQLFDALRILSPFGEVWRKTIRRWGSIINQQPQVVRRVAQGWEALHGQDLGAFFGAPAGQGFFHKDQYGTEVFSVPGTEWANAAIGIGHVPLVGSVQGLSIGTDIFPGLGPVASLPVAWSLEKIHAPLDVQQVLFPFGKPKQWNDLVNYTPTWFQRALGQNRETSPDSVRTFNNTVIDLVRLGVTEGDYDLSTAEGIQHAIEDATGKAQNLNFVRAAAQFFIPGSPSPQMLLKDKTGRYIDASVVIGKYRELQDENPQTAGQRFLEMYGPDVFAVATSKTMANAMHLPTSPDSAAWVDAHPELRRDMPHVYGFFAPPSDPDNFDYDIYLRQLRNGERVALTPEQWAKASNARSAALEYGALRDRIEKLSGGKLTAALYTLLAAKKQELMGRYPGYADSLYGGTGLPGRPEAPLLIGELQKAVNDPTVKDTDAGRGLVAYMQTRDRIDKAWVAAGYKTGTWAQNQSPSALALRSMLRQYGTQVANDHPQFGPLFEDVFLREMRDDTNPNTLGGG